MSIVYNGGLWTVFLLTSVSFGYVWALNAPKRAYKILLALAVFTIIASQFLPAGHAFRLSVAEGLHWWRWAITIGIPVLGYAWLVRLIKRKADAKHDS
jgi:hypothetical protein